MGYEASFMVIYGICISPLFTISGTVAKTKFTPQNDWLIRVLFHAKFLKYSTFSADRVTLNGVPVLSLSSASEV